MLRSHISIHSHAIQYFLSFLKILFISEIHFYLILLIHIRLYSTGWENLDEEVHIKTSQHKHTNHQTFLLQIHKKYIRLDLG